MEKHRAANSLDCSGEPKLVTIFFFFRQNMHKINFFPSSKCYFFTPEPKPKHTILASLQAIISSPLLSGSHWVYLTFQPLTSEVLLPMTSCLVLLT